MADPGVPGALTSPTTDGTLSGLARFAFAPSRSSQPGSTIRQVDFCLSSGYCASSFNTSLDGTWKTTELTGHLTQGPATLYSTVSFTDPLGVGQTWRDAGTPVSVNTTALALAASLDPARGVAPLVSTLTINASDPSGLPLSYTVNFGDGTANATGTIDYPYDPITLGHTFVDAGLDSVRISVSDSASGFAQQQLNAAVLNPTLPIALSASPSSGTAPLADVLTLTTSDVSGQPVSYNVAFGDGQATSGTINSPYLPLTLSHTYNSPGTFVAGASVSDPSGTTGRTTSVVTVAGAVPLVANAGDDQTGVAGHPVTLDGSASQPSGSISAYAWNFGDGSTGTGSVVNHTYGSAGNYTAILTVTSGGHQAVGHSQVTIVAPPAPTKGLTVTVTDGANPISGASVAIMAAGGARYSGTTDADGRCVIAGLADGTYTAYAYASGYQPNSASATQTGGSGSASIALQAGSVAQTSATSTPMSRDQIVAAGINPADPANQNVYQFEIHLAFFPTPSSGSGSGASCPVSIQGDLNANSVINPVISNCSGEGVPPIVPNGQCDLCFGWGGYMIVGFPHQIFGSSPGSPGNPSILWMIIPGKAKWLKEFFDVKMIVSNLAPAGSGFSLDGGSVALGALPSGLSLAPTAVAQTQSQTVGDIPAGGSASADWILRGDTEGYYAVTGNYTGTLDPIGVGLSLPISTVQGAIHVWGGSAIHMIVDADDQTTVGYPYLVRIGLQNVADVPVYNPSVELLTQGRLNYIYQPKEQLEQGTDVIQPGGTFWTHDYRLVSEIGGTLNLSRSFVKKTAGNVDVSSTIQSHAATPIGQVPTLTVSSAADGVHLDWQAPSVSGISGYQIFYTPSRDTLFGSVPMATVSAATRSTVLTTGNSGYYAVSAVVNGVPTMFSPLVTVDTPGASLTVNPSAVVPGLKTTVSGSGFGVGSKVKLYIDRSTAPSVGSTTSGTSATFSKSVTIGALSAGQHVMIAIAANGKTSSTPFTVVVPTDYTAMGDSYSSGEGTGDFLEGTDTSINQCHQSPHAYPALLDLSQLIGSLTFVACSGSVTDDIYNANHQLYTGSDGYLVPAQLCGTQGATDCSPGGSPPISPSTKVVTLTIGGNDTGFKQVLTSCVQADLVYFHMGGKCMNDATLTQQTQARMNALAGTAAATTPDGHTIHRLTDVLSAIHQAAPYAHVYMAGYPVLFGKSFRGSCTVGNIVIMGLAGAPSGGILAPGTISKNDATYLNGLAKQLNGIIKSAVKSSGKWATYVDPTTRFAGHGFCDSQVSWLNPLNTTVDPSGVPSYVNPFSFHPTVTGQQSGYEPAFVAAGL